MFEDYFVFEDTDYARIVNILRGAYAIRTANGEDDELLADLIEALDSRTPILPTDYEDLIVT